LDVPTLRLDLRHVHVFPRMQQVAALGKSLDLPSETACI